MQRNCNIVYDDILSFNALSSTNEIPFTSTVLEQRQKSQRRISNLNSVSARLD